MYPTTRPYPTAVSLDRPGIAARIRQLLDSKGLTIEAAASRLRVGEATLRMSADEASPRPRLDVLVALVREFALDPSWLMTGTYDPGMHRRAMSGDPARVLEELLHTLTAPSQWRTEHDAQDDITTL